MHVNLSFIDVMQEVPKYAKHIMDIVENKSRLTKYATIALTEMCNLRIHNMLSTKLKELGSFTIEITIGQTVITRALCDLAASINLMPSSIYKRWVWAVHVLQLLFCI